MCANPVQINKWFHLFQQVLQDLQLDYKPNNVWNIDESSLHDIPDEEQVIGIKGMPQMSTVAGEKGVNTTIMTFASAGGITTPPMIIFKCGKIPPEWREAAPTGYLLHCSVKGYVNACLFLEYGEHFVQYLKEKHLLNTHDRHLLLLDSHKSHLFNLAFMRCMMNNRIEVLCLPPHYTHLLQPLDDAPFASLKRKFQSALIAHNLSTGAKKLTKPEFFRIFIPVYTEAMSMSSVQAGYRNCGIYPVDPKADKLKLTGPSKLTAFKWHQTG